MSMTTVGSILIDKNLSTTLVESQGKFPTVASQFDIFIGKGTNRKLFIKDEFEASIVDELTNVGTTNDPTFAEIPFVQKRVASAVEVSRTLLENAEVDLADTIHNGLARRTLRTFQAQAFGKGNADGTGLNFQSILAYNSQTSGKIDIADITTLTGVTLANIDTIYNEFAENNIDEAIWVVTSASTVSSIVDGANKKILETKDRANGSIGTIYGIPVYVQDMASNGKVVLLNPKAYGVSIATDVKVKENLNQLSDKFVYAANVYAQGKVLNPKAIKIIK
ncbi:phage major capsid protein [Gottfriedia acidiceleris]|uniref:phage major capsid protein n=1 Tax=Gottfriedia acidiceleris TaxID=371036 RepID=UPI002FFDCCD7